MTTKIGDRYLTEVERGDPEIYELIKAEEQYQVDTIRLIPSENYTSRRCMEARAPYSRTSTRRLPGQALLRRAALHRRDRDAGAGAREVAVRRGAR